MRATIAIIRRFLITILRQKSTLFFMVVMPIIFTFMFGVAPYTDTKSPIAFVNEDHTKVSTAIMSALVQDDAYRLRQMGMNSALNAAKNGSMAVVIQVPKGFQDLVTNGKQGHFELTPSPNYSYGSGQSEVLTQLEAKLRLMTEAGRAEVQREQVAVGSDAAASAYVLGIVHSEKITSPIHPVGKMFQDGQFESELTNGQRAVVGFATMFIMFTVFNMTGTIFLEKKLGTWNRFKASPMPGSSILAGYGIGFFTVGWLQFIILYLSGRLLFGIELPINLWMVLAVSLYILAVVGIALCVSGLVKSYEQHNAIGSFVSIATCMIGGAYWPVDIEPVWMQHVAWLVPQNWAMSAFKFIVLGSGAVPLFIWPLVVLFGFAVIFFSAGMVQLKYS